MKSILITVLVLAISLVGGYFVWNQSKKDASDQSNEPETEKPEQEQSDKPADQTKPPELPEPRIIKSPRDPQQAPLDLQSLPAQPSAPALFDTGLKLNELAVSYFGQKASNGKLVLDANNGFFDKGRFKATGKTTSPASDKAFISSHFNALRCINKNSGGSAHWYLWLNAEESLTASFYLNVSEKDAGSKWKIVLADQEFEVTTVQSDGSTPQPWNLKFKVDSIGKHKIAFIKADDTTKIGFSLLKCELEGKAIETSAILRARWRPAAIHPSYQASTCAKTKLWVFESRNGCDHSNYSPMTTPFGYFGATFSSDRKASGGVNFSMWAAGHSSTKAPPLSKMPHILATGNPDAEFGGFGHEGSGVKIRNWVFYKHRPTSVIQALRVESNDGIDTYYGYLFDERSNNWVLYAMGNKPSKNGREVFLRTTSFCEVPGPPHVERTGDKLRTILRRGWVMDQDGTWHQSDSEHFKRKSPSNKFITTNKEGWFMACTGGLEIFSSPKRDVSVKTDTKFDLPNYLSPEKVKQLHQLPVTIGKSATDNLTSSSATVSYDIKKSGTNATASLHYGTVDCITFVKRKLHGTEKKGVSGKMLADDRTWSHQTPSQSITAGKNTFTLKNLKPDTVYYYRVLTKNDSGKVWARTNGSFRTAK